MPCVFAPVASCVVRAARRMAAAAAAEPAARRGLDDAADGPAPRFGQIVWVERDGVFHRATVVLGSRSCAGPTVWHLNVHYSPFFNGFGGFSPVLLSAGGGREQHPGTLRFFSQKPQVRRGSKPAKIPGIRLPGGATRAPYPTLMRCQWAWKQLFCIEMIMFGVRVAPARP
eukprot:gene7656-biopygen12074